MQSANTILGDKTSDVNVYDIKTKKIIFTGSQKDASNFIGTSFQNITNALRKKSRIKKKFAVRFVKD